MSKSDSTKAQIMRAAMLQFTRLGYEGAGVRAIANAAGVNVGLISYYFGHKADVYRDTLAHISEVYNTACLSALREAQASENVEEIVYAWLAAPYTHWPADAIVSGEEVLCFLNKMGYESPELTHDVYVSHYSDALSQWQRAILEYFPGIATNAWFWWLTCLRGMYFGIVAHSDFTLWDLPNIIAKKTAIRRLSVDAVALLRLYMRHSD